MIDSHCHLDLPQFAADWQRVLAQAKRQGVERILIPGTTAAGWQRQDSMAQQQNNLDLSYGIHPYFIPANTADALMQLDRQLQAATERVVAVGEIGLDGGITAPMAQQQALFEEQLALASCYDLPVILHHYRSHHLLFQSLKRCRFTRGGIVHGFSGSLQVAQQYIQAGFKLGVGGVITYTRAKKTRATLAAVGLDSLVLETDAPDMPLAGHQGERNLPEYIPLVAAALAQLQQTSVARVAEATTSNYRELFA